MITETKTADTILERTHSISLGGKVYDIAPPTLGTLILISEQVATLPKLDTDGDILKQVLATAKDAKALARIAAIAILGARQAMQQHRSRLFGRKRTELDALAEDILNSCTISDLNVAIATLLMQMQIGDFFACTTSLTTAVNITKATKEVETASGRS